MCERGAGRRTFSAADFTFRDMSGAECRSASRLPHDDDRHPDHRVTASPAGTGERIWIVGDTLTFKATADTTGGTLTAIECEAAPGGGPPPHVHVNEDESFYVLDGGFEILLGDELLRAGPGDYAFVPRGTVHRFANVGDDVARILILFTPGGLEQFFRAAGTPATDDGPAPPSMPPSSLAPTPRPAARPPDRSMTRIEPAHRRLRAHVRHHRRRRCARRRGPVDRRRGLRASPALEARHDGDRGARDRGSPGGRPGRARGGNGRTSSVYGLVWRVTAGPPGNSRPRDVAASPPRPREGRLGRRGSRGRRHGATLASTTRFVATDDTSREPLRAAWALVGAVSTALRRARSRRSGTTPRRATSWPHRRRRGFDWPHSRGGRIGPGAGPSPPAVRGRARLRRRRR